MRKIFQMATSESLKNQEIAILNEDLLLISTISIKGIDYTIQPIQTSEGIAYEIEGIRIQPHRMQRLYERGLLEIKSTVSFVACPFCKGLNITINLVCPNCKSSSLIKSDFLIHYECGYIAPVQEFTKELDKYVCPKCNKILKTVGIDYGKPGISFRCNDCLNIFQFPLVILKCGDNHKFKVDEADILNYPIYKFGKQIIYYSKLADILYGSAMRLNSEKGLDALVLFPVVGMSGTKYVFPLVIKRDDELLAVVELLLDARDKDQRIIELLAKSVDLECKVYLIVLNDINITKFTRIINPERIKIIYVKSEEEIPLKLVSEISE